MGRVAQPVVTSRQAARSEIVKMPDRGHTLTIDAGWREVAGKALEFVKRFTSQPADRTSGSPTAPILSTGERTWPTRPWAPFLSQLHCVDTSPIARHPKMWNCCSDARRPSSSLSRSPPLDGPSARAGRPRLRRGWPAARAVATVRCTDPPNRAQALRESSRRPRRTAAAPHPARTTRRRPLWPSPFRCQRRWCPALSRPWRRSWRRPHRSTRGARTCLSPSARFRSTSCSPSS